MASSAAPIPQPVLAVQRYFEVSLFLLVATGTLSVVTTGKLEFVSEVVVPVALLYKGIRIWRGRGPELSSRLATALVLAYFLFFPFDLWVLSRALAAGGPNAGLYAGVLAAVHLMLFATLVRLYSARTNRDYAFLAVLAVTALLAAAVLTANTAFLIALGVFLILAVSTFVALEIRRSAAHAVSTPLDPGSPGARQLNRVLMLTSVLVAIAALLLGGAIFFMIPRFTTGYFRSLAFHAPMTTGFNESVTLGEIGQIQKSSAVAMRIAIRGDARRAADIHWRGVVLTDFDGRRWFTPRDKREVRTSMDGVFYLGGEMPAPARLSELQYTVFKEPMDSAAIFLAPRPERVRGRFDDGASQGADFVLVDTTGAVFAPSGNSTRVRYEAVSMLPIVSPADLRAAPADFPDAVRGTYLQLPPLDPRIKQLAEQATSGSHDEYDRVNSLELYLKAHYAYTLDLRGAPGSDPIAGFLFTTRSGNCEYFASALAVMLRSIGIPARYAGGFFGGEYNSLGNDYIIRQSDAHAWVEVYFPGYGWLTFDPTPPGSGQGASLLDRAALYWDWFQLEWNDWVINYDFSHQIVLVRNTAASSHEWNDRVQRLIRTKERRAIGALLAFDRRAEATGYFLPVLLALLIGTLLFLRGRDAMRYLLLRWSMLARPGGAPESLATLEYREFLRLLERRGLKKAGAQTPLEFAAAISRPDLAAPVAHFTEMYQAARFGRHPQSAAQLATILRGIRESLRRSPAPPPSRGPKSA